MESTGRSPTPGRGGPRWRGRRVPPPPCRSLQDATEWVRDAEESIAEEVARQRQEEMWRNQELYDKVMLLHLVLASPEDRARMAEPIGWRPLLPTNISLEMQVSILEARLEARIRD